MSDKLYPNQFDIMEILLDAERQVRQAFLILKHPTDVTGQLRLEVELLRDELRRIKAISGNTEVINFCDRGLRIGDYAPERIEKETI